MDKFYSSDWHIHTNASYDASLTVEKLFEGVEKAGITDFGITDHVNQPSWISYLKKSSELVRQNKKNGFHLGTELTTIPKSVFEYDKKNRSLEGYITPSFTEKGEQAELPLTKEELAENHVEYVIAAAHYCMNVIMEEKYVIEDYHRQQMFLAADSRVDIVGHPWWIPQEYSVGGIKKHFDDFSVIPKSMIDEFADALIKNNKIMEYNILSFAVPGDFSEKLCRQYAEFTRYMFERGVKISIGSDIHGPEYDNYELQVRNFLEPVGFKSGDFSSPAFKKY